MSEVAAAGAGSGLLGALGSIGSLLGGGASLASTIMGLIQMGRESPASRAARHTWQKMRPDANALMSQLFQNEAATGAQIPGNPAMYKKDKYGRKIAFTPEEVAAYKEKYGYHSAPSQATQNLYANYLNRSYGLSSGTARALSAQALQPIALNQLSGNMSAAAAYSGSQINGQAMANAALGTQQGNIIESQDYLQNAGKLAAYNLWRSQQIGQTIG